MLRHNLLLIYRSFKKFKSTFFINLIGLSTGLTCALLIFLWVREEKNMDKFNLEDSNIFQIMVKGERESGVTVGAETAPVLAEVFTTEFPEVELAVAVSPIPIKYTLIVANNMYKCSGAYVGPDYLKIFSYELIIGNKEKILLDSRNIVLSDKFAEKIFGNAEKAVGQVIEVDGKGDYVIAGVYDVPANASIQPDFLLPLQAAFDHYPNLKYDWNNQWVNTHVLLNKETDLSAFNHKIEDLVKSRTDQSHITLFARQFSQGYLFGEYENGIQSGGRVIYVRLFSLIAIFIVFIACINFVNLSTANGSRRFKELGIKKTLGANRLNLALQLIGESMLMAFLSLLISILMVFLLIPGFNEITGKELQMQLDLNVTLIFFGLALLTGVISGVYPALYFSGIKPISALKGKIVTSGGGIGIRKGLIVFQFITSFLLIVSVLVVYKQMELVQNKQLGYNKDNVLFFPIEGKVRENPETFISEIRKIPGVLDASSMFLNFFGSLNGTNDLTWQGKDPNVSLDLEYRRVNYGLTELLDIEMVEGRTYSQKFTDTAKIIFNETAIAAMGLEAPVGKTVRLWNRDMEIIGVAKDFHFQSLHEMVKPLFFFLNPERTNNVVLRLKTGREKEALEALQDFYRAYNPGYILDYQFLDQEYQIQYQAEKRVSILSRYFAGLAILISCLGLFGLVIFTSESRIKEIGVRKVLGANEWKIVQLLSVDFAKLVMVAIVIGLPLSIYFTKNWLDNFAYKIDLDWWYFLGAGALTMLIALLTVSFQSIKAALMNPVESLRSE